MWLNKIKLLLLLLIGLLFNQGVNAQFNGDVYYAQFSDKLNSPFSYSQAHEFLSDKAIQRRVDQNITFDERDLPIIKSYIQKVIGLGANIQFTSKWLNGIGFIPNDASSLENISNLSFIQSVELIKKHQAEAFSATSFKYGETALNPLKSGSIDENNYGYGWNQIKMLNGDLLHQAGFRGEGVTIAVLDNGFMNADQLSFLDSIWINEQVISTYDFVKQQKISFNTGSHGTKVLSVMAANTPETLIGTAPKANYHLLRTEIKDTESILEEYLWVCGAEYADSVGADIINSSLSYTEFDGGLQNHSFADLDGKTTIISKAAEIAFSKGILLVNSAGNYGNKSWQHVGAPADAENIMAIGAVSTDGIRVDFSSIGPTSDGRMKPNIVAQGAAVALANTDGGLVWANGTSFSSPIIAGLAACLWQSNPQLNNLQLKENIEKSSNRYFAPNDYYGYGIPDFYLASQIASFSEDIEADNLVLLKSYPNPFIDELRFVLYSKINNELKINISDISGKTIISKAYHLIEGANYVVLQNLDNMPSGMYIIEFKGSKQVLNQKLIKLNR